MGRSPGGKQPGGKVTRGKVALVSVLCRSVLPCSVLLCSVLSQRRPTVTAGDLQVVGVRPEVRDLQVVEEAPEAGRGGGGGEGVTIQTQEPMDGEVKPTDGALMVEVRVTLQTQEPIEAVAEVRVAGHPRNATEQAWSTFVDVEEAEAQSSSEHQILALWLCFVRVFMFKRVE